MENVNITIKSELKRRTELVYNDKFRANCKFIATTQMGITEQDWNKNKITICMLFANQVCKMQNA